MMARHPHCRRLLLLGLALPLPWSSLLVRAQPLSLPEMGLEPCPLVVPSDQAELQPLRLHPSQVALKNSLSCLSPTDAVYGANGCPLRLCTYPRSLDLHPQFPRP